MSTHKIHFGAKITKKKNIFRYSLYLGLFSYVTVYSIPCPCSVSMAIGGFSVLDVSLSKIVNLSFISDQFQFFLSVALLLFLFLKYRRNLIDVNHIEFYSV